MEVKTTEMTGHVPSRLRLTQRLNFFSQGTDAAAISNPISQEPRGGYLGADGARHGQRELIQGGYANFWQRAWGLHSGLVSVRGC
ncbi:hypothetical protein GCM10025794_33460 [Massilia kyonggiensis]